MLATWSVSMKRPKSRCGRGGGSVKGVGGRFREKKITAQKGAEEQMNEERAEKAERKRANRKPTEIEASSVNCRERGDGAIPSRRVLGFEER